MSNPTNMQIDNMEFYATCLKEAQSYNTSDNFAATFGRFVAWLIGEIPDAREPGVLRYRVTVSPDLSMPFSFYGALVRDMESKTHRGQVELVRNAGMVYDRNLHTWGVYT